MRRLALVSLLTAPACFEDAPPVEDDDAAADDEDSSSSAGERDSSGGEVDCEAEFDACEPACDGEGCTAPWDQCRAELYACDPSVQQELEQCWDDQLHAKSACWTEQGCGIDQGCRAGCEIQARNDFPCEEPTPGE